MRYFILLLVFILPIINKAHADLSSKAEIEVIIKEYLLNILDLIQI